MFSNMIACIILQTTSYYVDIYCGENWLLGVGKMNELFVDLVIDSLFFYWWLFMAGNTDLKSNILIALLTITFSLHGSGFSRSSISLIVSHIFNLFKLKYQTISRSGINQITLNFDFARRYVNRSAKHTFKYMHANIQHCITIVLVNRMLKSLNYIGVFWNAMLY